MPMLFSFPFAEKTLKQLFNQYCETKTKTKPASAQLH